MTPSLLIRKVQWQHWFLLFPILYLINLMTLWWLGICDDKRKNIIDETEFIEIHTIILKTLLHYYQCFKCSLIFLFLLLHSHMTQRLRAHKEICHNALRATTCCCHSDAMRRVWVQNNNQLKYEIIYIFHVNDGMHSWFMITILPFTMIASTSYAPHVWILRLYIAYWLEFHRS